MSSPDNSRPRHDLVGGLALAFTVCAVIYGLVLIVSYMMTLSSPAPGTTSTSPITRKLASPTIKETDYLAYNKAYAAGNQFVSLYPNHEIYYLGKGGGISVHPPYVDRVELAKDTLTVHPKAGYRITALDASIGTSDKAGSLHYFATNPEGGVYHFEVPPGMAVWHVMVVVQRIPVTLA